MVLTKHITYRGKQKAVKDLPANTGYKVDVLCPECGKVRNVYYRSVRAAGHTICLKCLNKQNIKHLNEGDVYSRLTVISTSQKTGYSICRCECGVIIERLNTYIVAGKVKSCGCLKSEAFANSVKVTGSRHGMWKGGVSSERERMMSRKVYKDWRTAVYERDNYICQKCKAHSRKLNAHHIESYKQNEKNRTCLDNGITLCYECHMVFHNKYGKDNNRQQLNEFLFT